MFGPGPMFGVCPTPADGTSEGLAATVACMECARERYDAVDSDPRWPAALVELTALGFNGPQAGQTLADIMLPHHCVESPNETLRLGVMAECSTQNGVGARQHNSVVWQAWVRQREAAAWSQAILPAARAAFPNVRLSLFNFYSWNPASCVPTPNLGTLDCQVGSGAAVLSVQAPAYYGYSVCGNPGATRTLRQVRRTREIRGGLTTMSDHHHHRRHHHHHNHHHRCHHHRRRRRHHHTTSCQAWFRELDSDQILSTVYL